jgi:hypothetical protein
MRLIDPELSQGRGEKKQRNNEVLGRLWLLPAKDEKCNSGNEGRKNKPFDMVRVFEIAKQFIGTAAAPFFARNEPASDQLVAFE